MLLELWIFTSLYYFLDADGESWETLGCWRDSASRSMASMEGKHIKLDNSYKSRRNPIDTCGKVATEKGYKVFAVQNGGQCFGGPYAHLYYNKYGPSNLCREYKGGIWSSTVYSTNTFHGRSLEKTLTKKSAECNKPLDIVFLLDGSGKGTSMERDRWDHMVDFVNGMIKSFSQEQIRTGIITYGSTPRIITDLNREISTDNIDKRNTVGLVPHSIKYPGGPLSINSALTLAWKRQFRDSRRPANKIIVALTTGDIPYGIWGSSQFLNKRNIRVVAVGVDKRPSYKFLESISTGSYPRNIFSLDTAQLKDAIPYVDEDICKAAKRSYLNGLHADQYPSASEPAEFEEVGTPISRGASSPTSPKKVKSFHKAISPKNTSIVSYGSEDVGPTETGTYLAPPMVIMDHSKGSPDQKPDNPAEMLVSSDRLNITSDSDKNETSSVDSLYLDREMLENNTKFINSSDDTKATSKIDNNDQAVNDSDTLDNTGSGLSSSEEEMERNDSQNVDKMFNDVESAQTEHKIATKDKELLKKSVNKTNDVKKDSEKLSTTDKNHERKNVTKNLPKHDKAASKEDKKNPVITILSPDSSKLVNGNFKIEIKIKTDNFQGNKTGNEDPSEKSNKVNGNEKTNKIDKNDKQVKIDKNKNKVDKNDKSNKVLQNDKEKKIDKDDKLNNKTDKMDKSDKAKNVDKTNEKIDKSSKSLKSNKTLESNKTMKFDKSLKSNKTLKFNKSNPTNKPSFPKNDKTKKVDKDTKKPEGKLNKTFKTGEQKNSTSEHVNKAGAAEKAEKSNENGEMPGKNEAEVGLDSDASDNTTNNDFKELYSDSDNEVFGVDPSPTPNILSTVEPSMALANNETNMNDGSEIDSDSIQSKDDKQTDSLGMDLSKDNMQANFDESQLFNSSETENNNHNNTGGFDKELNQIDQDLQSTIKHLDQKMNDSTSNLKISDHDDTISNDTISNDTISDHEASNLTISDHEASNLTISDHEASNIEISDHEATPDVKNNTNVGHQSSTENVGNKPSNLIKDEGNVVFIGKGNQVDDQQVKAGPDPDDIMFSNIQEQNENSQLQFTHADDSKVAPYHSESHLVHNDNGGEFDETPAASNMYSDENAATPEENAATGYQTAVEHVNEALNANDGNNLNELGNVNEAGNLNEAANQGDETINQNESAHVNEVGDVSEAGNVPVNEGNEAGTGNEAGNGHEAGNGNEAANGHGSTYDPYGAVAGDSAVGDEEYLAERALESKKKQINRLLDELDAKRRRKRRRRKGLVPTHRMTSLRPPTVMYGEQEQYLGDDNMNSKNDYTTNDGISESEWLSEPETVERGKYKTHIQHSTNNDKNNSGMEQKSVKKVNNMTLGQRQTVKQNLTETHDLRHLHNSSKPLPVHRTNTAIKNNHKVHVSPIEKPSSSNMDKIQNVSTHERSTNKSTRLNEVSDTDPNFKVNYNLQHRNITTEFFNTASAFQDTRDKMDEKGSQSLEDAISDLRSLTTNEKAESPVNLKIQFKNTSFYPADDLAYMHDRQIANQITKYVKNEGMGFEHQNYDKSYDRNRPSKKQDIKSQTNDSTNKQEYENALIQTFEKSSSSPENATNFKFAPLPMVDKGNYVIQKLDSGKILVTLQNSKGETQTYFGKSGEDPLANNINLTSNQDSSAVNNVSNVGILSDVSNANSDLKNADSDLKNANSDLKNANSDLKNTNSDLKNANSDLKSLMTIDKPDIEDQSITSEAHHGNSSLKHDVLKITDKAITKHLINQTASKGVNTTTGVKDNATHRGLPEHGNITVTNKNVTKKEQRNNVTKKEQSNLVTNNQLNAITKQLNGITKQLNGITKQSNATTVQVTDNHTKDQNATTVQVTDKHTKDHEEMPSVFGLKNETTNDTEETTDLLTQHKINGEFGESNDESFDIKKWESKSSFEQKLRASGSKAGNNTVSFYIKNPAFLEKPTQFYSKPQGTGGRVIVTESRAPDSSLIRLFLSPDTASEAIKKQSVSNNHLENVDQNNNDKVSYLSGHQYEEFRGPALQVNRKTIEQPPSRAQYNEEGRTASHNEKSSILGSQNVPVDLFKKYISEARQNNRKTLDEPQSRVQYNEQGSEHQHINSFKEDRNQAVRGSRKTLEEPQKHMQYNEQGSSEIDNNQATYLDDRYQAEQGSQNNVEQTQSLQYNEEGRSGPENDKASYLSGPRNERANLFNNRETVQQLQNRLPFNEQGNAGNYNEKKKGHVNDIINRDKVGGRRNKYITVSSSMDDEQPKTHIVNRTLQVALGTAKQPRNNSMTRDNTLSPTGDKEKYVKSSSSENSKYTQKYAENEHQEKESAKDNSEKNKSKNVVQMSESSSGTNKMEDVKIMPKNNTENHSKLKGMLGCQKPVKVIYALDVSEGLGIGPAREKRWTRLKQFLNNVNKKITQNGGNKAYVVYDVEPRYLKWLEPCDAKSEYFVTSNDCLCNKKSNSYRRGETSCSTHSPTGDESKDDWGAEGPRTGNALAMIKQAFQSEDAKNSKKLVVLVTHRSSTDDVTAAENDLRDEGISLVDIEIGDRHNIKKRSNRRIIKKRSKPLWREIISSRGLESSRIKRSKEFSEIIPRDHQMEVSFQRLDKALGDIFTKLCDSQNLSKTRRSRIYVPHGYRYGNS